MQRLIKEKVNVWAVFRGFKDEDEDSRTGWEHKRIEPRAIKREKGPRLKVLEVRRSYGQRKGKRLIVHFVVRCEGDRYFHLVYDTHKVMWLLMYEFDDQMLFDDIDFNVDISWNGKSRPEN